MTNAKIQLKDGGTYANRLGQTVTVQQTNDGAFPFEQTNGDRLWLMVGTSKTNHRAVFTTWSLKPLAAERTGK